MSERTNETILTEMLAARKDAAVDLDALPTRLRPSHEIAAREARELLGTLRAEYMENLLAHATAFLVSGPPAAQVQFASVAETGSNAVTVNVKDLHAELAAKIYPAIGSSREFTVDHISMLNDQLWKLKQILGVVADPRYPTVTSIESIGSEEELADYIKKLMGPEMGGPALNARYIVQRLTDGAMEKRFVGKTLPVVVINGDADDNEAIAALFKCVQPVDLNGVEAIDRAFAIQVFKEAKAKKQKAANQAQ